MPKPTVSKLLPRAPKGSASGPGRRQQYSAATKRALVEVATELFAEQGYGGTSLEAIVTGAEVTKGALYHHFSGKQALFEAVFERVEEDAARVIRERLAEQDPWEKALGGLRAFLEVVQAPAYQRIVIQDGPAVLGHERYRELRERATFANLVDIVGSVLDAGPWDVDAEMTDTFARIFFGAMSSAGESVASAGDPEEAASRVETAITYILAGLRSLAQQEG